MPHVQVRNVPEAVHQALIRRAERAGQSLQQYLSQQLETIAATPTLDEILDQIDSQDLGTLGASDAIDAIADERARR